jgi:hypothetical protein
LFSYSVLINLSRNRSRIYPQLLQFESLVVDKGDMANKRPQRGRPKGTGINDDAALHEIARLIASNPKLRPTSAIKLIGVANPSTIRRLRDKYNSRRFELAAEITRAGNDNGAVIRPLYPVVRSSAPAPARSPAPRSSTVPGAVPGAVHVAALVSAAARAGVEPPRDPSAPHALWFGLGIAAAVSAIEQQLTHSEQLVKLPNLASLLRQQVEMAEMMMALAPASKRGAAREAATPVPMR